MSKKLLFSEEKIKNVFGEHFDFSRNMFEDMLQVSEMNPLSTRVRVPSIKINLNEGLIHTYPYDKVKRFMCEYFNIPSYYFHDEEKKNGIMACAIDIPKEHIKIYNALIRGMNLCGYFKSIEEEFTDFVRIHFEAKFEKPEEVTNFLYHVTHYMNSAKIEKIGLRPSKKNKIFKYPSRIYFLKQNATKDELIQAAENVDKSHNTYAHPMYFVYRVNLDKLPYDVKFYPDPNMENAVYTMNNIPPSAIVDDFNTITLKKNKDGEIESARFD